MRVVGFDPGLNGGLAFLADGDLYKVIDMPTVKTEKDKKVIDTITIYNLLQTHRDTESLLNTAAIEVVHAMPKQGVTSMFTFGFGYGLVKGAIECAGYFSEPVRPQAWKKHFGLIGKEKSAGLLIVERLWPDESNNFISKKGRVIDGRVDAALIARYYWEKSHE